jgi:hypothetical protein
MQRLEKRRTPEINGGRSRSFFLMAKTNTKKSNKVEIRRRIEEVKLMLVEGYSRSEIVQFCSKDYRLGARGIDKYISKAFEEISLEFKPKAEKELVRHLARREYLFKKAINKNDLHLALKVDDSAAKLKGLLIDQAVVVPEGKTLRIIDDN